MTREQITFEPIHIKQANNPTIGEFFVFGERNSGTNFIDALMRNNFSQLGGSASDRIEKFGFRYGWKHGFPTMMAAPDSTLAIVTFRDPLRWAQSMHRKPWHAANHLVNLSFTDFIRATWQSVVDERNFGIGSTADVRALQEMHWDRHPMTGAQFENVLKLRAAKNQGFLSLKQRFKNVIFVRYEDVSENPEQFVRHIAQTYNCSLHNGFTPVEYERGRKSSGVFVPRRYPRIADSDREFIWSQLDMEQERSFGYVP